MGFDAVKPIIEFQLFSYRCDLSCFVV